MSLLLGGLIASGIGAAVSTGVNAYQQHKNRKHASAEAEKQRQWEEQMSNTAYQRGSADMQAAGLNPAMMYSGGGGAGASTPHGATAAGINSPNIAGDFINSAANLAKAFNYDNNPKNDVNLKQIQHAAANIWDPAKDPMPKI